MDVNFYMKVHDLKSDLMDGIIKKDKDVFQFFEQNRSKYPIVYNIETTNYCNMTCGFCPRTTRMTRDLEHMNIEVFKKVVDQITPHSPEDLERWDDFVENKYKIKKNEVNENHFLLNVIAKSVTLHGWGSPFLDLLLAKRIALLTKKGFDTYFSCNPTNIRVDAAQEMIKNGLTHMKMSIESVNDERQIKLRGDKRTNFKKTMEKLNHLLSFKEKNNYKTQIIITMLNQNSEDQEDEYRQLEGAMNGKDVYMYLKNRDNQWNAGIKTKSTAIHWSEFCQDPWSSFGIQNSGLISACGREDYNNELIMGDINKNSLLEIWNSDKYRKFRQKHFTMPEDLKCTNNCDAKMIGSYVEKT